MIKQSLTWAAACAALALSASASAATSCAAAEGGRLVETASGARIAVRTIGTGQPVVMLPSLGRSASDFDGLATMLADAGWMTILPEPRGIGGSSGAPPESLFDLASDVAGVIGALCDGPVDVVGHAYGNRVARALAVRHPALVRQIGLLAGGGSITPAPNIVAALRGSFAQGIKPDDQRLIDLQTAFFAHGHDASVWLTGWYPAVAAQQMHAVEGTVQSEWWTAGGKTDILLVQALQDPIAPRGNADQLKQDIGTHLSIVYLSGASHAILPEQPAAVAAALAAFFSGARDEVSLQTLVDAKVHEQQR